MSRLISCRVRLDLDTEEVSVFRFTDSDLDAPVFLATKTTAQILAQTICDLYEEQPGGWDMWTVEEDGAGDIVICDGDGEEFARFVLFEGAVGRGLYNISDPALRYFPVYDRV